MTTTIDNENKKELNLFLNELTDSIKNDALSAEQLQHISEFYISYKLSQNITKSTISKESDDIEDIDVIKFITLGWYIYTFLLNQEQKEKKEQEVK
jgi:hypothetical protein